MVLCKYFNTDEVEKYKNVSDPDLNELLQQVRAIDDGYYIAEEDYAENRWWYEKPKKRKIYTLFHHMKHNEYQVLNLCKDGLDIDVNVNVVGAYLLGFLNGNRKSFKDEYEKFGE